MMADEWTHINQCRSSGWKNKINVIETTSDSTTSTVVGSVKSVEAEKHGVHDDVDTTEYPKSFALFSILLALMLSVFLVALDMTIVATAIPRITDDFHSLEDIGWYGSAFLLTLASFQSMWGKAYKYFPLKLGFLVAIGIFEGGSLICAIAPNSALLIVGRAVAGFGGAGIASGAYTIIALSAPPARRPIYTGLLGAVYAIASVVGPPLGGRFTDGLGWRWCFWINLPIGAASCVIILAFFKTPAAGKPIKAPLKEKLLQMDPLGTGVLMGAIICVILGLQWGGITKSWTSPAVLGTLIGSGILLIAFVGVEIWQDDRAAIEPRLMKQRTIYLLSIFQVFNSGLFLMFLYYLPLYFQVVAGVSASESGIRNLPYVLGISVFTIISGIGITLTGQYIPFLVLAGVTMSAGAALVYTLDLTSTTAQWIGYQILASTVGLSVQIPVIVGQAIVAPSDVSAITAIMVFFQTLSGAVFVSVGQSLFANKLLTSAVENVPGINPQIILGLGATALRTVFPPPVLQGILKSYMAALQQTYFLGIVLGCLSAFGAYLIALLDWKKLTNIMGMAIGGG